MSNCIYVMESHDVNRSSIKAKFFHKRKESSSKYTKYSKKYIRDNFIGLCSFLKNLKYKN